MWTKTAPIGRVSRTRRSPATLNAYFSGLHLTTFREGDHQVPVYFRLSPEERRSPAEMQHAFVEGNLGKVPLGVDRDRPSPLGTRGDRTARHESQHRESGPASYPVPPEMTW